MPIWIGDFNSIKVRLELIIFQLIKYDVRHFNSIKVRLEHKTSDDDQLYVGNFNSIKVRLEHSEFKTSYDRYKFQFHKGAIRTA